jgi:quercetin dioxygenase-like cupin family protein
MKKILLIPVLLVTLLAQTTPVATKIVNSSDAKWQHDSDDPPGGESLILRMDRATGAMEFMARYPAGFAFKPHAHKANERFLLFEGKASVEAGGATVVLDPGGYAYFPTGQTHSITCVAAARCMFFVAWDAKG